MHLHDFLKIHRDEILARCRSKVASRPSPVATEAELHGVPLFLDQLIDALITQRAANPTIGATAAKHGRELLNRGFSVAQVVHDYGDVCQAVTELAGELDASIATEDFRVFNRCLDDAIADAVTEYVHQRGRGRNKDAEPLGALAHELRNLLNAALLSYEVLKSGTVGVGGSTGAALGRSLTRMQELVHQTVADVRIEAGVQRTEEIALTDLMEDLVTTASLEARAYPILFAPGAAPSGVVIEVDRQILTAALTNIVHNAFKFTRPQGRVSLRTSATADRVRFDVEDECGGLASEDPDALFAPFAQFNADRSGLGLGLGIAYRGVAALGGSIHVHNRPGIGCVFTVDLPLAAPRPAPQA